MKGVLPAHPRGGQIKAADQRPENNEPCINSLSLAIVLSFNIISYSMFRMIKFSMTFNAHPLVSIFYIIIIPANVGPFVSY